MLPFSRVLPVSRLIFSRAMPYTFDNNPRLFRIALVGHITMWDLHGMRTDVSEAEKLLAVIPPRIIDLSGATSGETTWVDLLAIVEDRREQLFPNAFKVALVAPRDIDIGNARQFQILADSPQIRSQIFENIEEAEQWLAVP